MIGGTFFQILPEIEGSHDNCVSIKNIKTFSK